ncbi:MAG: AsmA family protein [Candidatus Omnitrophota bacterium]
MKKILVVLIVIIIAFFTIGILKDQIIKSVVTVVATQVTGAPVHIDGFSLGLFKHSIRISASRMFNPSGFPRGILVDLPRINVDYDLSALLRKKLHLFNVEVELKEMDLVRNKEGKLNVDALKVVEEGKNKQGKPSGQMPLQIDMLKLGMGRIILKDYSSEKEPVVKVYDIKLHKGYKNITSTQQLTALILTEPMKAAGIQGAQIYGVAMLAGVAVFPVALAATFTGKDSAAQDFAVDFDKVYNTSLAVLRRMGKVAKEDRNKGMINAEVNSAKVELRVNKKVGNKTEVFVSARRYLLPRPEVAGGILYEISEKLK